MKKNNRGLRTVWLVVLLCAGISHAQRFRSLLSFDGIDGYIPVGFLSQGTDGNFYGTSVRGGSGDYGVVFKMTPAGVATPVYNFCSQEPPYCLDGGNPEAGLTVGSDGNLYGTTSYGGSIGGCCGTIFKLTLGGVLTTLHAFDFSDGSRPAAVMALGADGNFYGTTSEGGAYQEGTIFRITPTGTFKSLYSFCPVAYVCSDGAYPYGTLVLGRDGDFYGTTSRGGTSSNCYLSCGTVFKVTPTGTLSTVYSFCAQSNCLDGSAPGSIIQATDGSLYGPTSAGGANGYGSVFRISTSGTLTTLYSFCALPGCVDGSYPSAILQAPDGNFYGVTSEGGVASTYCDGGNGCGTIFEITPGGALTTLHSFCDEPICTDGSVPVGLSQGTNGNFYGTADYGGAYDGGTAFASDAGIAPFVQTLPTVGKLGAKVVILGNNLTGASAVTFNGTSATFTVVSATEIRTTVPTGATTGKVQVTTPTGTLTSNVVFRVK